MKNCLYCKNRDTEKKIPNKKTKKKKKKKRKESNKLKDLDFLKAILTRTTHKKGGNLIEFGREQNK